MDTLVPVNPVESSSITGQNPLQGSKKPRKNVIVIKRQALTTKKAVELLLSGTLKSKVCRYCLYITSPLSEMDQIMQIAGKRALYKVTIRDIVASVHPFKVPDDPNFPNKICEKCLTKALQSYLFAQKCEQSGRALRNCFEDMYEKLDKLDPLERVKKRGRQKLHPNNNILYTENRHVIDYAEPIHNLINVSSVSFTNEPFMQDLECKKCWQVLPNVESLANHEKMHPKSMWFNCRLCGKSFAKKIHIKRHLRIHAKGKIPNTEEKDNFVCKQCGHSTDNHNIHLQHIEKHKFQTVLEHLVERKMDKLCSVCLNSSGKMIEMDKMICLHGGYPELTGDRSLYNILGATVPEPNSKYQELIVPQKSTIITFTKKTNKPKKTQIGFIFSPPKIITLNEAYDSGIYVFEFSQPIDLNSTDIQTTDLLDDLKHYEHGVANYDTESTITSYSTYCDENIEENHSNDEMTQNSIEVDDYFEEIYSNDEMTIKSYEVDDYFEENHSNDQKTQLPNEVEVNFEENNNNDQMAQISVEIHLDTDECHDRDNFNGNKKQPIFTFSKPEYVIDFEKIIQVKTEEIVENTEKLCVKCWIFNKPTCEQCSQNKYLDANRNIDNNLMYNHDIFLEPCYYCWIFKLVGKCGYCKKSVEVSKINIEQNTATDTNDAEITIDCPLNIRKAKKRKLYIKDVVTPKKTKWQCNICLTTNNRDRETCQCCQSEKAYDESVKIKMNYKFFEFMKSIATVKENLDINQNNVKYELSETMSKECLVEHVNNEEQTQISENSIEMMDLPNLFPEINKKDDNVELCKFEETLEMTVEDNSFPSIIPKIEEPLPLIITREDKPIASPSIFGPILPFTGSLSSYPNPFSFHHAPQNDYQFTIGSMHKEDKLNNIKNIRKSVKRLKSIRK